MATYITAVRENLHQTEKTVHRRNYRLRYQNGQDMNAGQLPNARTYLTVRLAWSLMLVADDVAVGPPIAHSLDDVFLGSIIEFCDGKFGLVSTWLYEGPPTTRTL